MDDYVDLARVYRGGSSVPMSVRWNGRSDAGARLPAGVYWLRFAPNGAAAAVSPGAFAKSVATLRVVLLP